MQHTTLGSLQVSRIGLGAMTMSAFYTGAGSDDNEAIRTIHRALDLGVTLIDTAEIYGPFTNEELVGRAIKDRRDDAVIATKFGNYRHGEGGGPWQRDSTPDNIRLAIEGSLKRLGIETIDLYYQHRVDPEVPIEDVVGTLAELRDEGKLAHIGLSEASAETVRRAAAVTPIAALQTEYSLWTRDVEEEILPTCRELGIGFVAYSPLGRGFLTGKLRSVGGLADDDFRKNNPRFQGDNLLKNIALVEHVEQIAAAAEATPAQVALAWLLSKRVVPIPGTKRVERLEENAAADAIAMTAEQLRLLDQLPPAAGERYPEQGMASVNL